MATPTDTRCFNCECVITQNTAGASRCTPPYAEHRFQWRSARPDDTSHLLLLPPRRAPHARFRFRHACADTCSGARLSWQSSLCHPFAKIVPGRLRMPDFDKSTLCDQFPTQHAQEHCFPPAGCRYNGLNGLSSCARATII
jgi:hypothetical protein